MDYLFHAISVLASLVLLVLFRKVKAKKEKQSKAANVFLEGAVALGLFFLVDVTVLTHSPILITLGEILVFVSVAALCFFWKKNSTGTLHIIFLIVLILGVVCFAVQKGIYDSKIVTAEVPTLQREEIQISNMVNGYFAIERSGDYIFFPVGGEKFEKIPTRLTEPNYVPEDGRLVKVTKTYTVTDNNTTPPTQKEPITEIRYELFVPEGSIQTIK